MISSIITYDKFVRFEANIILETFLEKTIEALINILNKKCVPRTIIMHTILALRDGYFLIDNVKQENLFLKKNRSSVNKHLYICFKNDYKFHWKNLFSTKSCVSKSVIEKCKKEMKKTRYGNKTLNWSLRNKMVLMRRGARHR
jgi:hypothetical protein